MTHPMTAALLAALVALSAAGPVLAQTPYKCLPHEVFIHVEAQHQRCVSGPMPC